MSKDYKEMYLKEKMRRLSIEGELLIMKHERLMLAHEGAKEELKRHQNEKMQEEINRRATEAAKKENKKEIYKRKKK